MVFSKNLRYLRLKNDMSQDQLAEILGYKTYTTIQKWESGKSEPNMDVIIKLANLWKLSIDDLVTKDLEANRYDYYDSVKNIGDNILFVYRKICVDQEAIKFEEPIMFIKNPYDIENTGLFALEVHGDSMNQVVSEGFYAIIKEQPSVESGSVVAVCIDDETATLKKYYNFDDVMVLRPQSTNSKHKPITLMGEEMNRVRILGKMVGSVGPMM